MVLARVIYNVDLSLAPGSRDWVKSRKNLFVFWARGPLSVYIKLAC